MHDDGCVYDGGSLSLSVTLSLSLSPTHPPVTHTIHTCIYPYIYEIKQHLSHPTRPLTPHTPEWQVPDSSQRCKVTLPLYTLSKSFFSCSLFTSIKGGIYTSGIKGCIHCSTWSGAWDDLQCGGCCGWCCYRWRCIICIMCRSFSSCWFHCCWCFCCCWWRWCIHCCCCSIGRYCCCCIWCYCVPPFCFLTFCLSFCCTIFMHCNTHAA